MGYTLSGLDDDSLRYMAGQFEGGQGLAHLLGLIDLRDGVVRAFLPDDDSQAMTGYEKGSLRDAEEESEVVTLVCNYLVDTLGLTSNPNIALLGQFPDGARRPTADVPRGRQYSTAWLAGAEPPYYNGELWYVAGHAERTAVRSLLADLLWFPAIATVIQIAEANELRERSEIGFEVLAELVREPRAILVGGWDAMNYLLWTPEFRS